MTTHSQSTHAHTQVTTHTRDTPHTVDTHISYHSHDVTSGQTRSRIPLPRPTATVPLTRNRRAPLMLTCCPATLHYAAHQDEPARGSMFSAAARPSALSRPVQPAQCARPGLEPARLHREARRREQGAPPFPAWPANMARACSAPSRTLGPRVHRRSEQTLAT